MADLTYTFECENGDTYRHSIDLDLNMDVRDLHSANDLPEWTKLSFGQCEDCQWKDTDRCPVAVAMLDPVNLLHDLPSYEKVQVTVDVPQRQYRKQCDVQEGVSGLFGAIMATSGCPAFKLFRGLVDFHLPFASFEETLFRNVSAHLLSDYLTNDAHYTTHDIIEQVHQTYDVIGKVNIGFLNRLRKGVIPENDATSNAIVILDTMGMLVSMSVDDGLDKLKQRFAF